MKKIQKVNLKDLWRNTKKSRNILLSTKSVILSIFAISIFFVPMGKYSSIVVLLCDIFQRIFGKYSFGIILIVVLSSLARSIFNYEKKNIAMCIISLIMLFSVFWGNMIELEVIALAASIVVTVTISGSLSYFITDSGLVEYVSFCFERVFRKLICVPGYAAMDIITSFFASSSVGVYVTEKYYLEKKYTKREAAFIASNYSVVSFGFMYALIRMASLEARSALVILLTLIINFLLGIIMVRIYPIRKIENEYCDGRECMNYDVVDNFSAKIKLARAKVKDFNLRNFLLNIRSVVEFCFNIVIQVIPIYTVSLILMRKTRFFQIMGMPFSYLMNLLHIKDADLIGPTGFIGIFEVSLPCVFIQNIQLSSDTRLFVTVLSLVQIVFFTETANAILKSKIPISIKDLILIFLIRTALSMVILSVFFNFII